jgi:hypothetical protein
MKTEVQIAYNDWKKLASIFCREETFFRLFTRMSILYEAT